jgi:glycosyltransferase involved in cell wall biosynthesis
MASALRQRKRIEDFLQMIRNLRQRHPHVMGVLAGGMVSGEQPYAEGLMARLKAEEAEGHFRWLGNLEHIEPFMQGIDVYVSTSEYETFGMSVCEAMACGRPVVAYRAGSLPEVMEDTGRLVALGDVSALTAAVEDLVVNETTRTQIGEGARRRVVEHFDCTDSLRQLRALFGSVLAGKRTPAGSPQ